MSFELHPLEPSDAPRCIQIYFDAFQNAHSIGCWPRSAAVRKWWEDMLVTELSQEGAHHFQVVHVPSGDISSWGKWRKFQEGQKSDQDLPETWPEGSDKRLADETFGAWMGEHPKIMGTRAHWYLEMLATDPKYQGKGSGARILRWGVEKADSERLEAYLEASPEGLPVYEHFGFREAGRLDTWIENERVNPGVWYCNYFMLRPAKSE